MSFLDRFKSQPKWKHSDPLIRASAVDEIPDEPEYREALLELARDDQDVRVRRAAMARIEAVEDLVRLAAAEKDDGLRTEIAERLVEYATRPADTDGAAAIALEGLTDQKQFAAVARSSPFETVRTAALGRIHDARLLSAVARQAADPQTALEAVARVADTPELVNIALKTEHKDAGVAALERAAESGLSAAELKTTLETVAARARHKAVGRRAKAMLQAIEDEQAARRAAQEQWQQRLAAAMARVEALAAAPHAPDAMAQLAESEAEWRELAGSEAFELDEATATRFAALVSEARAAIARAEREEAERRAEAERQAALRAVRISLCERVECLRGDDLPEQLDKARAEWEGLAAGEPEADEELRARFEDACRRALERHRNRQEIEHVNARLAELAAEAERLAAQEDAAADTWGAIASEWDALFAKSDALDPGVAERYRAAEARLRQREEEKRLAAERALKQQLQRLEQLIDRATRRATAEDLTLREADRAARDLRAAIENPPALEASQQHALVERLKGALGAISPRLHELREMDEWKRFANAAVQEELIAATEALRTKYGFDREEGPTPEEVEKAARELHDIQERWKQVAEAPRAQAQALWHRYRQAADPIQAKARELFAIRAEERKANLARKLALIERAEALADSTDWIKTADELKRLQAEWQQIGPVPRQETRTTWKRFREACDKFFSRRNADLAERKEAWAANLAKKEALCARAEEIAASRDWEKGAAEIRRLQAEWKTIGPVRRNKSEAIWQRFRTACDTFFDRYKRRDEIELEAKQADREALVTELEALAPPVPAAASDAPAGETEAPADPVPAAGEPPADLVDRVRSLRTRWNQTTPVVRHGADPLSARFVNALERLIAVYPEAFKGTELDIDASRQRMEKLCARVEGFIADVAAAPAGSSQALAEMLREALAANTIGGRAGEETKWRAMAEEVRQAQAAWARLVPVPGEAGRQLTERFHRACNRFFDQYRRKVPATHGPRGGKPVGAR